MSRSTRELHNINTIAIRANEFWEAKEFEEFHSCIMELKHMKCRFHPEKKDLFMVMWVEMYKSSLGKTIQ